MKKNIMVMGDFEESMKEGVKIF